MAAGIDLTRFQNLWSEQDRDLFWKLPIHFTKIQSDMVKYYSRFTKLLTPINWDAHTGTTMRGIRKESQPILRSQVLPNPMTSTPLKDVIEVSEVSEQCQLYRQDFETDVLHMLPTFFNFLPIVESQNESMQEQIMVYLETFYRTAIFHGAPKVWICGKASGTELTSVPYWAGPTIALSKNANTMQQLCAQVTGPLNLRTVAKIATMAQNDENIMPFSGKTLPDGTDGKQLAQKYCLICSSEVWDYFPHDPAASSYKALDLDLLTDGFRGSLFGKITSQFMRFEERVAADGTFPAPETTEENPAAYNYRERVMRPTYVNSPVGVAYLVGGEAYKYIKPGPPPKEWTGMKLKEFANLDWNGKVGMTQNVLIPSDDHSQLDTNKRGEYLQLIASLAMGIMPIRRRNIIPILYLRTRVQA